MLASSHSRQAVPSAFYIPPTANKDIPRTFKMQAIERSCDISCDIQHRVVYSTDPTACPTFLHMHNEKGYCMPDTISTSSLIIKFLVPNTADQLEFFYVTSHLQPPRGHSADKELQYRPVRLGKCVPVGMKVRYPVSYEPDESLGVVELVHIHKQKNETKVAFEKRISLANPKERIPMSLSELSKDIATIGEFPKVGGRPSPSSKTQGKVPIITIERYQQTLYAPTSYYEAGRGGCDYRWQIPLELPPDKVGPEIAKLSGSDNGSLVYLMGGGMGFVNKSAGKILGIITLIETCDREGEYAIVRPMVHVIEDLHERLYCIFDPRNRPKGPRTVRK